ncbi:C1 family peptidase [Maribacter algicola]|uniref:C1 family peptidase n=1 Tax=Meishania litoralis TaxID=3434685 RepID=A0ACC7LNQ7_9FLAO
MYELKTDWITGHVKGKGLEGSPEIKLVADDISLVTGKRLTEIEQLRSFDLREHQVVTIPKNQGICGCNWAFVATSLAETAILIEDKSSNKDLDLSEQFVLDCSEAGDSGKGSIVQALGFLKTAYLPKEENYRDYDREKKQCTDPVNQNSEFYKIGGFKRVWGDYDADKISEMVIHIKYALYRYGAVSSTIIVNDEFKKYAGGVFNYNGGYSPSSALHLIQIIGWDNAKKAWLIKNSWGTDWGEEGFAWVNYEFLNIGASSICIFNKEDIGITGDIVITGDNEDKNGIGSTDNKKGNGDGSTIDGKVDDGTGDGRGKGDESGDDIDDDIRKTDDKKGNGGGSTIDGKGDDGTGDDRGNGNDEDKTKVTIPDPPTKKGSEHIIDAAIYHNGHSYFFSGNRYSRFTGTKIDKGYPREINKGWKGLPNHFQEGIDAALFYPPTGQIYFFKGHEYVRFTPQSNTMDWEENREELAENQETNSQSGKGYVVDAKYPLDLPGGWKGLPADFASGIDAAIYTNGFTYFFKGNKYVRFRGTTIDDGYETPKTLPGGWKMDDTFHENIGASFYYPDSEKNYFFKGNRYLRLKTYQMDKAPTDLPGGWKGLEID